MRIVTGLVGVWLAGGLCVPALAQPKAQPSSTTVTLLSSHQTEPFRLAQNAFTEVFTQAAKSTGSWHVEVLPGPQVSLPTPSDQRLYLALGSTACERLARQPHQARVLCALLSMAEFEQIRQRLSPDAMRLTSALVLDQPLERQARLMRLVWPDKKRLGVLLGEQSAQREVAMQAAARVTGFDLQVARLPKQSPDFHPLFELLTRSELLWAVPDPDVFSVQSAYSILLASWQRGVPLIAFSPAFVKAGAVLGLYVTPQQVGQECAELILAWLRGQTFSGRVYLPNLYEIDVNNKVAAAYGLQLDVNALRGQLLPDQERR